MLLDRKCIQEETSVGDNGKHSMVQALLRLLRALRLLGYVFSFGYTFRSSESIDNVITSYLMSGHKQAPKLMVRTTVR